MSDLLEIPCLPVDEVKKLAEEIERRVAEKKKEGLVTEREIREIEEMRLRPLADILDVQCIYENHLFSPKD